MIRAIIFFLYCALLLVLTSILLYNTHFILALMLPITFVLMAVFDNKTSTKLWIWIDQGVNSWAGYKFLNYLLKPNPNHMFGSPDETLSSVIGKNRNTNKAFKIISSVLDAVDRNHSIKAIEEDEHHHGL